MDGLEKDENAELVPSLALTLKSAEESSEESTVITTAVVCGPQESFKDITTKTSSDTNDEDVKMAESPGKSPHVHDFEDFCLNGQY